MSGSTSSFPPLGLLDPAQGGQPPPGSGLGALYQAVNGNMMQQQGAVPTLGTGWNGLPAGVSANPQQWTTAQWDANPQGPTAMMRAAQPQQQAPGLDPMTQNIVDAIASGNPQQGAMLGQILGGRPTPSWQNGGQGLLGSAVDGGGAAGDRGPSQGNQGQQDAATAAGGMAASGDKGPSAGGGTAASGHDQDEEGPF